MTQTETLRLALEAMNAMLTHMGMDEDEWNKVTFDQTRKAITAIKAALEAKDEPVAWEGGEDWESLAWQLCADECGEEACTELIWEGGPIPEPWGDRWMKYEYEAKRLIALVRKHTTPPQRKPLTDEQAMDAYFETPPFGTYKEAFIAGIRFIEAAHGIKGEA